jgi:hypothetical protein
MNRLDALKARVAKATLGKWWWNFRDPTWMSADQDIRFEDSEFIAHARSDIERLVAVVEAVENPEEDLTWGQMERMRKARAYWLEEEK